MNFLAHLYLSKDNQNIMVGNFIVENNGTIAQSEIVEENHYYPFGLKHKGYNSAITGRNHKYGFGGKEEQDDNVGGNSLDWIDFGFRNYDASLGRWMNADPLAEMYFDSSPYVFTANNPIYYVEIDGRCYTQNEDGEYVACEDGEDGDTRDGAFGFNWTYGKEGWQITNGSIPDESVYTRVEADGSAAYYENRYVQHILDNGTRPPDYLLEYGYNNRAVHFEKIYESLSEDGKEWFNQTAIGLQVMIESALSSNPSLALDNNLFEDFAFNSHVDVYFEGRLMYNLPDWDLVLIGTAPTLKDFVKLKALKQTIDIMDKLGKNNAAGKYKKAKVTRPFE